MLCLCMRFCACTNDLELCEVHVGMHNAVLRNHLTCHLIYNIFELLIGWLFWAIFVDIVILFLTLYLQNLSEYDIKTLRISQESKK